MTDFSESKPEITATFQLNCSDSCPCPTYLCDGQCPCPVPPPGALQLGGEKAAEADEAAEADDEAAPEVIDTMELMNSFENDMRVLFRTARENHIDYFVVGVFIANHFPSVAWIFLSYAFSIPSINLIQQPNLFRNVARMNLMYLSLLLGICGGSQLYAMYCLSNVFPSLLGN